ncbi:MAG: hypothetical protein M3Y08_05265 [Fibrobacterota bacterium]|nr:hypothetical protein [Fibrobacterota bacterium]
MQSGTYLARNDSGALVVLSLPAGTKERISTDTIMGIQGARWHDLRLENGKFQAVAAIGDTLALVEKEVGNGQSARWTLPKVPDGLEPYREVSISFGGNSDYLRVTAAGTGGLYYTLPLKELKLSQARATWSEEQRWIFNKDVSVRTRNLINDHRSHVEPAILTFRDLKDQVLAEYDFSNLIRK